MNTEPKEPSKDHEERLALRAKIVFDDSLEHLDGRTRSRLNQARHAALEAARGARHPAMRWLLPTGSLAALALVAVVAVQMLHPSILSLHSSPLLSTRTSRAHIR